MSSDGGVFFVGGVKKNRFVLETQIFVSQQAVFEKEI